MADDVKALVEKLRDEAIDYYATDPAEDHSKAVGQQTKFKYQMQSIASRIAVLRQCMPISYDLESELIAFRRAVTGGTFESILRRAAPPSATIFQELWSTSDQLVVQLHAEFWKQPRKATAFTAS